MSASNVNGARSRGLRVSPRPRGNWIVVALDPCFRLPAVVTYLQSNCVKEYLDERERSADGDGILGWRIERLREVGCSARLADTLARDGRYDLHALLELVDRGCPVELAARILTPLRDKCEPC